MELSNEEKKDLYSLFRNVKKKTPDQWKQDTNNNILLVDGTNLFLRGWHANPSMDDNGGHVGGLLASLKSLGYVIKLLYPTRCIVVFDGIGGSFKRRKIFPEYKENRKGKIRLNRVYEEMSDITTEEESCRQQYVRFIQYLRLLPVNIVSIDYNEADDVIAYCAVDTFKKSQVIIMSTDKDFLQLVDDRVKVWSPTKKILYGPGDILREYGIHPTNFVLFRAMDGDDSDCVNGIHGVGIKTTIKCFPFLAEGKIYTLDDIINHAIINRKKYKVCEKIIEGKDILYRNIQLMQLKETLLTTTAQLMVNELLETQNIPKMDRNAFVKLIVEDSMLTNFPDHHTWINECFSALDSVTRSE